MPTPTGWITTDPLCGENDPYGRDDTANQYARTLWTNLCAEHNQDGTHQGGALIVETGSYQGNNSSRTISLRHATLSIMLLIITAQAEYAPIMAAATFPAGYSKVVGISALQSQLITSLATPGQFTVSANNTVNQTATTYDYAAYCWVAEDPS